MGGEEGGFSGLSGWENLYYRRNVAEDSAFCRLHGTGRLRSGADLGFVRMPLLQLVVACDSELPGAGEKNPVGNAEHSRTPHRLRKEPARGKNSWQRRIFRCFSSLKKMFNPTHRSPCTIWQLLLGDVHMAQFSLKPRPFRGGLTSPPPDSSGGGIFFANRFCDARIV